MRRMLLIVFLGVLLAAVRQVLLDRQPRRALHGSAPVIGSLDTWPAVPRRPTE
jgi:hypothetical protein